MVTSVQSQFDDWAASTQSVNGPLRSDIPHGAQAVAESKGCRKLPRALKASADSGLD
jgi:hypothetical protein